MTHKEIIEFITEHIIHTFGIPKLSKDLTSAIPRSYSRKMNQMIAYEIQDLYWFRHVVP